MTAKLGLCSTEPMFNAGTNATQLLGLVEKKHPTFEKVLDTCTLALNEEYIDLREENSLKNGDEVAIIPPISGG